ncbi:MAG: hypothetical protein K1X75_04065 [Leptospirales bacterium]|nr:hypothetical protein [Leptospirales bacterium]
MNERWKPGPKLKFAMIAVASLIYSLPLFFAILKLHARPARCLSGNCEDGRGQMEFPGGAIYSGGFREGRPHGNGSVILKNGERYEGQWVEGRKEGAGVYTYQDGFIYRGRWTDNRRQGRGELEWPDGTRYSGEWLDGLMDGHGELSLPGSITLRGVYRKGRLVEGKGLLRGEDGHRYLGDVHEGRRNGFGVEFDARGAVAKAGIWKDDELVQAAHPPPSLRLRSQERRLSR